MKTSELLDQFIIEARECIELIGRRLLDVERSPGNTEWLNDLFRQVHTLKGNCGLFDFKPLERVVHAGEDVLDRVRHGALPYSPAIADALLAAMDCTAEWVDHIAHTGELPDSAPDRAQTLAATLRQHLGPSGAAQQGGHATPATPAGLARPNRPLPAWCADVPTEWRNEGMVALRYRPEAECFFKGEDPWHLALSTPGLQHLSVRPCSPWPPAETFDCYACNLELLLVSEAPATALDEHFRYVPEQVEAHAFAAVPAHRPMPVVTADTADTDDPAPPAETHSGVLNRALGLWQEQCQLLRHPDLLPGAVVATRLTLHRLAQARQMVAGAPGAPEIDALPSEATALLAWAEAWHGAPAAGKDAAAEQPAAKAAGNSVAEEATPGSQRVLRVSQHKIDRLMELIGEMVVAKNAMPYLAVRAEEVYQQRELAREIKAQYAVINRIAEDMQHAVLQVRMLPVGAIFQRFARLVRDISKRLNKEVNLVIEGEDTEADKHVIESLADPLIHILRNSLDHGIESPVVRVAAGKPAAGTLRVQARQEGDRVLLDISDDGAGIDTDRVRSKAVERGLIPAERAGQLSEQEAMQLVFLPGFSTTDAVSDLSGRGVGMDVVRSAVERVHGTVVLDSTRGLGTRIRLTLPLSMAVTSVMLVDCAGLRFGVPMDLIVETVRVPAEDIHHFKRSQTVVLRGRVVPLRALADLLGLGEPPRCNADGEHAVLVIRYGGETLGLLVDDFQGTSDIILKPLEGVLSGLVGFAGTALMGDGSVLMVLNPRELT